MPMKILVGAALGAAIGLFLAVMVVGSNWRYAGQQRQRIEVPLQAIIGGAVAGALIAAFL